MNKKIKWAIAIAGVSVGTFFLYKKRWNIGNAIRSLFSNNSNTMQLELKLKRKTRTATFTLGELSINGQFFCYTLEDTDRGLTSAMSESQILSKKIASQTAIPTGTYTIDMDTISPKYSARGAASQYANIGNKLPRLNNVKGFSGVLIHIGNTIADTDACILVGTSQNKSKGTISNSRVAFNALYARLLEARAKKQQITINVI